MTPVPFYVVDWHSSDANPEEEEDDKSEEDSSTDENKGGSKRTQECKKIFSIQAVCID